VVSSAFKYKRSLAISAMNRPSRYKPWPPNMRRAATAPTGAINSSTWATNGGGAGIAAV
jgi:hypothetical protein